VPFMMVEGGCGARKRFSPVGGAAKGIFLKYVMLYAEEYEPSNVP